MTRIGLQTFIAVSFLCLFIPTGQAQIHVYDQFINDNKVGTLTVNAVSTPDSIAFTIYSEVEVDLWIKNVNVVYDAEVHYSKHRLTQSSVRVEKNGKLREQSKTWLKNGSYWALIDGEEKKLPWNDIDFSSLLLYVEEPINRDSVFAEIDGVKNKMTYQGNGTYEMEVTTNGNQNLYHYKNGQLVKAKLDHWLAPIHLKLRE